jgi:hypothetical protein
MRNAKFPLLAVCAYLALVGVMAISTVGPAHTQGGKSKGPDVRVINTSAEPVPVSIQGVAQIDSSSPLSVKIVETEVRQPFHAAITESTPLVVPAGKRLVIEHVTGLVRTNGADAVCMRMEVETEGQIVTHNFPLTLGSDIGHQRMYSFSGPTRLYADPGSQIEVEIFLVGLIGSSTNCSVSGYLVDAP